MSHLRRLTTTEKSALPGEVDYARFASFDGVLVGLSGGDCIVHVRGADRAGLPGTFEADDFAGLHNATKGNVLEAEWEEPEDPEDPESPMVRVRGKKAAVPPGASVIETDIVPHSFL